MNVKALIFLLIALPSLAFAQGFAGLGSDAEGFSLPDPDTRLVFPRDHGAHPDFRIEWWYMTANLTGSDGQDYGVQWTLFRSAFAPDSQPGWTNPQFWMGHAAITTPDHHYSTERFARGGIGQADVQADPFLAFIDDWQMRGIQSGDLRAFGPDFSYDLRFDATGPFVAQGADGYSVKSASGQASHYYSQPFYQMQGTLRLPDGDVSVTGQGWLDREWSSQPLSADQTGWDWLSLHFDNGAKMMAFSLRSTDAQPFLFATWITPQGQATPLDVSTMDLVPLITTEVQDRAIPTTWQLRLPSQHLDITIAALNPQSWMNTSVAYWEGPVQITGSHPGRGYLEMTGYE